MYIYMRTFASFSQKPISNYIRKDSYYWITIITYSVYLLLGLPRSLKNPY